MTDRSAAPTIVAHGASELPSVTLESYNLEVKDEDDNFVGDRASNTAFRQGLEDLRRELFKKRDDPLGRAASSEMSKREFDKALMEGGPEAAGLMFSAVENFASDLTFVVRRFMKLKAWKDTERIVIGGGLRDSRVGEIAIGRAGVLLRQAGVDIDLVPIRHHPDEAGLIGALHLAPSWVFKGHDAILAVDIGGTNFRAGIVRPNTKRAADLSEADVVELEHWRHRDEEPSREEAVAKLVKMLKGLVAKAGKDKLDLAPFIGIGCPGMIEADGSIDRGSQNLPGNWTTSSFHLPTLIQEKVPEIGDHQTAVVMHNDAVVQGLSQVPFMADIKRWGVLTIGTGLGNAQFTNRAGRK